MLAFKLVVYKPGVSNNQDSVNHKLPVTNKVNTLGHTILHRKILYLFFSYINVDTIIKLIKVHINTGKSGNVLRAWQ